MEVARVHTHCDGCGQSDTDRKLHVYGRESYHLSDERDCVPAHLRTDFGLPPLEPTDG